MKEQAKHAGENVKNAADQVQYGQQHEADPAQAGQREHNDDGIKLR